MIGLDGGGVTVNLKVKCVHQVILVIIHCPTVSQGTATHPRQVAKPYLVHLIQLFSHLQTLISCLYLRTRNKRKHNQTISYIIIFVDSILNLKRRMEVEITGQGMSRDM